MPIPVKIVLVTMIIFTLVIAVIALRMSVGA